jgi:hypothetical protein
VPTNDRHAAGEDIEVVKRIGVSPIAEDQQSGNAHRV